MHDDICPEKRVVRRKQSGMYSGCGSLISTINLNCGLLTGMRSAAESLQKAMDPFREDERSGS